MENTNGSAARPSGSRFGVPITAEVRRIVDAMPVGAELSTRVLFHELTKAHPELNNNDDIGMLSTYISQSLKLLEGKTVVLLSKGSGGQPNSYRRIAANGANGRNAGNASNVPVNEKIATAPPREVKPKKGKARKASRAPVQKAKLVVVKPSSPYDAVITDLIRQRDELNTLIELLKKRA